MFLGEYPFGKISFSPQTRYADCQTEELNNLLSMPQGIVNNNWGRSWGPFNDLSQSDFCLFSQ